jgi:hypothetical protein
MIVPDVYGMQFMPPDPLYDKNAPLYENILNRGRCTTCGKRHLDYVTGHVLTLLKGSFSPDAL